MRFDASATMETKYPATVYYGCLGELQRFERTFDPVKAGTLYYKNHKQWLSFYDKVAEAKSSRERIPAKFVGRNLLRYELRFKKDIPEMFGRTEITGATLYEEEFFGEVVQRWHGKFNDISKINKSSEWLCTAGIKTQGDIVDGLSEIAIRLLPPEIINDYFANIDRKALTKPRYFNDARVRVDKILAAPNVPKNDLLKELEDAIAEIAKNTC
jgi:hypothetical protein